jgi:uncharacterized protein
MPVKATRGWVRVGGTAVEAIETRPETSIPRWGLIYAPGAGSSINDPFGAYLAETLTDAGITTFRFQFPYMEVGRRRPDPPTLLEQTWLAAIETAAKGDVGWMIGGRSMGGRFASKVATKDVPVQGLALFAYPLHPPKQPEKRRDGHLARIRVPTLFCSGTRDAFGSPDELRQATALVPNASLHLLEGADHGFATLKSSGRGRQDIWREAVGAFLAWAHDVHGRGGG